MPWVPETGTLAVGAKPFKQTHHHKKGGKYEMLFGDVMATDKIIEGESVVVYRSAEGILYVRPSRLFYDKTRFAKVGEKIAPTELEKLAAEKKTKSEKKEDAE